jgi:hypothetical protein
MYVEIGAEAALFPEKEYITELPLQCRTVEIEPRTVEIEPRTFEIDPRTG